MLDIVIGVLLIIIACMCHQRASEKIIRERALRQSKMEGGVDEVDDDEDEDDDDEDKGEVIRMPVASHRGRSIRQVNRYTVSTFEDSDEYRIRELERTGKEGFVIDGDSDDDDEDSSDDADASDGDEHGYLAGLVVHRDSDIEIDELVDDHESEVDENYDDESSEDEGQGHAWNEAEEEEEE